MTTATAKRTEMRIEAPELRGAALALGSCRDREVCIEGPAGTGKTVGALYKIHVLLSKYAGSRALVARKTNTALSGSAMVSYRDNILKGRRDIHWFGGNKVEPAAFRYPNGSELIVNGLDKAEKVQSAEFDWAFINETTECVVKDIEFVRIRLRPRTGGPRVPYRQLIMDCNPDAPTHWLNQRMEAGITKRLRSRHEDNPRYFDTKTQDWTEEGREYVLGILEGLTGVRYLRHRKGIWAAAEGLVYEEWNPSIHVLSQAQLQNLGIFHEDGTLNRAVVKRVIAGMDWGYHNAGTLLVFALDADDRCYLVHEIHRTQRDIDWWIAEASTAKQLYSIETFVCDPAQPSYIEQMNKHRFHAIGAENSIPAGISYMQSRLKVASDGRPRFFVYEHCLRDRDESVVDTHKPYHFQGEIVEYVWPKGIDGKPVKELPVAVNNHSLDAARYVAMFLADPTPTGKALKQELDARQVARTTVREKLKQQVSDQYW